MIWPDLTQGDRIALLEAGFLILALGWIHAWILERRRQADQESLQARLSEQDLLLASVLERLERVEVLCEAQESNSGSGREEDIVEFLGDLLDLNESLRRPSSLIEPADRSVLSEELS